MPIYEYKCDPCDRTVERLSKHGASAPACHDCASPMKKLVSRSSFALKGGGWYKDGYGLRPQKQNQGGPHDQSRQDE